MTGPSKLLARPIAGHVTIIGEGRPIVFIHGNASTREVWRDVTHRLANRFRCITYDLRGLGAAPGLQGPPTLERFVEDLEELHETLALDEPIAVVGQSLGAFVAASYAARHPEHVAWVGLLAMPANRSEQDRAAAGQLLDTLRRDGLAATAPNLAKHWYTAAFSAAHQAHLQKRLDQILALDEDIFIAYYELYCRVDVDALLPRIEAPVLVMTGEYARGAGADVARFISDRLPDGARVRIFPELKNGLMTEAPDRTADELAAFAEHASSKGSG
ncbi:MAG: alpha/beta fold hydrolase [Aliihoeflea sp.]